MDMPKVISCQVTDCCYNRDRQCHALAIQVGDTDAHPLCDTFTKQTGQCGDVSAAAGVGACKVESCEYNENLECAAQGITVGYEQGEADCLTFEPR